MQPTKIWVYIRQDISFSFDIARVDKLLKKWKGWLKGNDA